MVEIAVLRGETGPRAAKPPRRQRTNFVEEIVRHEILENSSVRPRLEQRETVLRRSRTRNRQNSSSSAGANLHEERELENALREKNREHPLSLTRGECVGLSPTLL